MRGIISRSHRHSHILRLTFHQTMKEQGRFMRKDDTTIGERKQIQFVRPGICSKIYTLCNALHIPGIEHAIPALDVYRNPDRIGKQVVIIGGGLVGSETGLHLAKTGHHVTIVEQLKRIAHESCGLYRGQLMHEIARADIDIYTCTTCKGISAHEVIATDEDGNEIRLEADTIIYALGYLPADTEPFETALPDTEIYKIGDCNKVAKIGEAIKSGYEAAINIL